MLVPELLLVEGLGCFIRTDFPLGHGRSNVLPLFSTKGFPNSRSFAHSSVFIHIRLFLRIVAAFWGPALSNLTLPIPGWLLSGNAGSPVCHFLIWGALMTVCPLQRKSTRLSRQVCQSFHNQSPCPCSRISPHSSRPSWYPTPSVLTPKLPISCSRAVTIPSDIPLLCLSYSQLFPKVLTMISLPNKTLPMPPGQVSLLGN